MRDDVDVFLPYMDAGLGVYSLLVVGKIGLRGNETHAITPPPI